MIVTPNNAANRTNLWAKIGMTVCFLTASAMLVSGLARGNSGVAGGNTTNVTMSSNR